LTDADIRVLWGIVGEGRCFTGASISGDYAHDELSGMKRMPDALIRVQATDEVSSVMKLAGDRNIPVVVRGAGTGLVGGAVAVEGGIMLETTQMNKILELDPDNLTVTVQPGVLLMELAEYVSQRGFLYPPDPGEKSATIGGNISTNAGGMRAVKYGVTRDYVRGMTVVLPDGGVMELGGKVVKNSSGYSLKDLIIGSEGTLAIVTEAILKLVPLPACTVSLLIPFRTIDDALDAVLEITKSKTIPAAIEYMSRETILFAEDFLGKKFPDTKHPAYLLLTLDGADKERVKQDYEQIGDLCLGMSAEDVFIIESEERRDAVWTMRGAFLEAIKTSTTMLDECDVVVPRNRIADYIKYTHQLSGELGARIPSFGHAGDGNIHIYLCRDGLDESRWERLMAEGFDRLYKKAVEMGGQVSGEHGVGYAKKEFLHKQFGGEYTALMRRIKTAFDPGNILNPGKIII